MIGLRFMILCLLCACGLMTLGQSVQKNDVIVTKQGALWEGKIIHDVEDDTVTLLTRDSLVHYFAYKEIRSVKYGAGSATASSTPAEFKTNTRYDKYVEHKRRVGMGLTITGIALTVVGTGLIAANPGNTNTYSGRGGGGVTFHNAAAVGVVMDLVGVPMLIAGAVKWSRAEKVRTRRDEERPTVPASN